MLFYVAFLQQGFKYGLFVEAMNALISLAHGLKAIINRVGVSQAIMLKFASSLLRFCSEGPGFDMSCRRKKKGQRAES